MEARELQKRVLCVFNDQQLKFESTQVKYHYHKYLSDVLHVVYVRMDLGKGAALVL